MSGKMTLDILAKRLVAETYFEPDGLEPLVFGEAAPYSYSSIYEILRDQMLREVQKIEDEAKR